MARSLPTPPGREQSDVILRFCNQNVSQVLDVVWVDYEGKEVHYATLKPGDSYGQGKIGALFMCTIA
jgi:VHL beta domain